jgi:orotate phosphoribosyltransferase
MQFITKDNNIIKLFEESRALLKGHFFLSAGLHSEAYVQCSQITKSPDICAKLCKMLAEKVIEKFGKNAFDIIVAPAMGGVIPGYEMGRQLGLDAYFCERVNGEFTLRRGYNLNKGARVLVIEDVITTGKSSIETFECIEKFGGVVVGEASLVNRNYSNNVDLRGVPFVSLLEMDLPTYLPEDLPEHLKNTPVIKPGSRFINE